MANCQKFEKYTDIGTEQLIIAYLSLPSYHFRSTKKFIWMVQSAIESIPAARPRLEIGF